MDHKPIRVIDPARTRLVIVGCGGTGGYVLQQAARLLYGLKEMRDGRAAPLLGERPPECVPQVLLIDGDNVERKNLLRQQFLPQDLSRNKALALADRYGAAYGLEVSAYPRYLDGNIEPRLLIPEGSIVVGCVDNAPTRRLLHGWLCGYRDVVYVDSGNAGVDMPQDGSRGARARARESGWEGQVLCGVRKDGRAPLPLPGDVLPDLLDGDEPLPTEIPCGQVVASLPQRHMVNMLAATVVTQYLTTLLAEGTLIHSKSFFDARRGYVKSYPALDELEELAV